MQKKIGNITWRSSNFVTEFGNIDIKSVIEDVVKEVKSEIENGDQKSDKSVIYKQVEIEKKDYQIIIETINSKWKNKKKKSRKYICNVFC